MYFLIVLLNTSECIDADNSGPLESIMIGPFMLSFIVVKDGYSQVRYFESEHTVCQLL